METYIELSIEERRLNGDLVVCEDSLVKAVKDALVQGAKGMYAPPHPRPPPTQVKKPQIGRSLTISRSLWVSFQIEEICAQATDDDIRKAIRSLSKDLPEIYERALFKIQSNRKAEMTTKMFRWVAAAKRPLSFLELHEAIAIEGFQECSKPSQLVNDYKEMVPWCANLLVQDEEVYLV